MRNRELHRIIDTACGGLSGDVAADIALAKPPTRSELFDEARDGLADLSTDHGCLRYALRNLRGELTDADYGMAQHHRQSIEVAIARLRELLNAVEGGR